ncbi:Conserved hypothetical protein, C-term fragment [Thermococcus gammatolerans EJ3]|uniref:PIN domain-containing protein n=1 Tax=Thermococcus gammatolerans (strain DSM 15229 / JCM 11827 / EJ3) TaxID=593117 RepID=C5A2V0_THEGJ|nr:Conserved hypothetical protein, C-term fragment [Thermococcus gammatolerans EJ3]
MRLRLRRRRASCMNFFRRRSSMKSKGKSQRRGSRSGTSGILIDTSVLIDLYHDRKLEEYSGSAISIITLFEFVR